MDSSGSDALRLENEGKLVISDREIMKNLEG